MKMLNVQIKLLSEDSIVPTREYQHDAGLDVYSTQGLTLKPGERAIIGTGFAMSFPPGWKCEVCPRSGNAAKRGLTVLNSPGTIDASYRDEIKVILINHDSKDQEIRIGDKIAQLVFVEIPNVTINIVDELNKTDRGENGIGSSGR